MRIGALVGEQVYDFRLVEVDCLFLVAVGVFQLDAIEADAHFRGVLDRRVADAQVKKAGGAFGRRDRQRLFIDSAAGPTASDQNEQYGTYQSDAGPFHIRGHVLIPRASSFRYAQFNDDNGSKFAAFLHNFGKMPVSRANFGQFVCAAPRTMPASVQAILS